jgi:hypothetical protein
VSRNIGVQCSCWVICSLVAFLDMTGRQIILHETCNHILDCTDMGGLVFRCPDNKKHTGAEVRGLAEIAWPSRGNAIVLPGPNWPQALQASERSELRDPTRANCWISAQQQPGKLALFMSEARRSKNLTYPSLCWSQHAKKESVSETIAI